MNGIFSKVKKMYEQNNEILTKKEIYFVEA